MNQILKILPRIGSLPGKLKHKQKLAAIHERFREFTMIQEKPYPSNLILAETVNEIPGCVVECGVWRGGMSAGIATIMGPIHIMGTVCYLIKKPATYGR